jgi:hypothetical protein
MPGFNCKTRRRICDERGSSILVFCWSERWITWGDYVDILGNHVHPVVQKLFLHSDETFQRNDSPIHTARSVQSWFKEHEDALRQLHWLAKSPDLNTRIFGPLLSVSESRVRSIFPPSSVNRAIRCSSWRVVHYSTRNCSELPWVFSKKGTGNRWPNSVLRRKCVFHNCFFSPYHHHLDVHEAFALLGYYAS